MTAMDSAQPRLRAQVASSTSTASRYTRRAEAGSRFQAGMRSVAGSPIPTVPKSMIAETWSPAKQQIARHEVGVRPAGWARPQRGRERLLPGRGDLVGVEGLVGAAQRLDRRPHRLIFGDQRLAPVRGRTAGEIDLADRDRELREVTGHALGLCEIPLDRVAAFDPPVHRPDQGYPSPGAPVATTSGIGSGSSGASRGGAAPPSRWPRRRRGAVVAGRSGPRRAGRSR